MENQDIPSNGEEENQNKESQPVDVDVSAEAAAETQENEIAITASDTVAAEKENITDSNTGSERTKKEAGEGEQPNTMDEAGATNLKSEEVKENLSNSPEGTKNSSPVKKEDDSIASSEEASIPEEKGESPSESEPAGTTDSDKAKLEPSSPKEEGKFEEAVQVSEKQDDDVKKRDPKSPVPAVKEEDSASMDVDSSDANEPETIKTPAEPPAANSNTTTTYSTRGRSTEAASVLEERPERIHMKDAFEDSPRPKDPSSSVSFLVEAMTEEERRTRTRFLPDVDGMTMLRKNEIKEDLALANSLPSIVSPSGLETRTKRLGGTSGRSNDSMDVDSAEVNVPIHDEKVTTIKLPSSTLTVPCDAFVAPKGVMVGDTDNSIEVKEVEPTVQSPSKVESVMSFNPPRPPESVGGKKKHRMIRWERRPEDIEVDMKNYRRTVQRTRQELQKSESQYERLEMIDIHLRHHFLNHSELLDKETASLQDQLEEEVEKLIEESELVGSRTRSRNLTKVDVVMRDVLTMLARNEQKDVAMHGVGNEVSISSSDLAPGIGGLNTQAFIDWERSTELKSMSPCISWIEPGQKVTTPYGEGIVIKVIPPESPPSNETLGANDGKKSELAKNRNEMTKEMLNRIQDKEKYDALLPLRVEVRLNYGTGIFSTTSIKKMESMAHFTDAQLAERWKGMIDSALKVGPCIDLQGMVPSKEKKYEGKSKQDEEATSSTDVTSNASRTSNDDFLTVGASLIPTKFGRGNFLHDMEIGDIEETLESVLYDGHGVLGRVSF